MANVSAFEALPSEILLEILSFLEPKHITTLQILSKRLLRICRDNVFWRLRCYQESTFLDAIKRRSTIRYADEDEGVDPTNAILDNQNPGSESAQRLSPKSVESEHIRIAANWDPTFPGEKVDWYDEYMYRNGPITTNWCEQPRILDGGEEDNIEVKGVALYRPNAGGNELFAVSPLDDGSVCLWDVKGSRQKKGSIVSKSDAALLRLDVPGLSSRSKLASMGITESVSVDSGRNRAFFAVHSHLVEVDLQTLQIVGHQPYEWTITTLSEVQAGVPLTVGTFNGIHLFDSRMHYSLQRDYNERVDGPFSFGLGDFSRMLGPGPLPPYAPLAQSGPQSILHMEQSGSKELISDDIFVAGRFSSILHYDRRMFPAIMGSLHSGARLCSLTSLPFPFSSLDSDLRRRGELSMEQVEKAKNVQGGRTLIGVGEYNTKGSLEIYGLSQRSSHDSRYSSIQKAVYKNRQTASRVKLLSVTNHGTRILHSDGDGFLKWTERDGFTEVRRHKIGHGERNTQPSLFASMPGSDEIARKVMSTQTTGASERRQVNDDDVLFWTGEKLGLVTFSTQPGFTAEDFENETRTPQEIAAEQEEQLYSERMRLALERQANDVKFVRYLGAGIRQGV